MKKKPNLVEALSMVIVLLLLVVYSVRAEISIIPAMSIAVVWAMVIARRCGWKWEKMTQVIWEKEKSVIEVFLIILAIGMFVGAMIFSGTIPAVIYYLIQIMNPAFVIVLSFVIPMIVSEIIGTSWGTAGTVGVIMIAIAGSMGVPLPIAAGAVASGSHVGQLCSPMADTANVAAEFAGTDTMTMIRRMTYYTIPVILLSIIGYLILGFANAGASADLSAVDSIRGEIASVFNVNPLVILPMVLVFVMTFRKKPILMTLTISSLTGIVFGMLFNHFSLSAGLDVLYNGFTLSGTAGMEEAGYSDVFLNLVNRGGILSMISAALIIIIASMYGTIMTETGAVGVITDALFHRVKSRTGLTIASIVTAGLVVALTSSSFLAGMMPKDLFLKKFEENGMDGMDLVSGAVTASTQFLTCIPWCDTAVFIAGFTGVPTLAALPYNFFGWGCALMAVILSVFGIGYKNGRRMHARREADHD